MTVFPLNSAAAVASLLTDAPKNTPWFQSNASKTRGTPLGRLPPKIMAEIGTPSGFCHWGSIIGQFSAGLQNLLFARKVFFSNYLNQLVTAFFFKITLNSDVTKVQSYLWSSPCLSTISNADLWKPYHRPILPNILYHLGYALHL
jgi:hypothetical protein